MAPGDIRTSNLSIGSAIAVAFGVQTTIACLAAIPPVIAAEIAQARGWDVEAVALYMPLVYGVAFGMSFGVPFLLARWGTIWLAVACIGCAALGEVALAVPDWRVVVAAPLLIGLAIAGMNPATSQILGPYASPANAAMITSIKQMGVPLGAAIAGLVGPALILAGGLMQGVLCIAGGAVLIAMSLAPLARRFDDLEHPIPKPGRPLDPVKELLSIPGMRVVVATATIYVVAQFCLRSFLPIFLIHDLGLALPIAGLAFTVSQASGIAGQLFWASLSGRIATHHRTLACIGALMAASSASLTLATPDWPLAGVLGLSGLFGFTAAGFIPVVLGAVMSSVAPNRAGAMTSAANVCLLGGSLAGPILFGIVVSAGGYAAAFLALAALCAGGATACAFAPQARAISIASRQRSAIAMASKSTGVQ